MQVASKARGLVRVLRTRTFLNSDRFLSLDIPSIEAPSHSSRQQWRPHSAFSAPSPPFPGMIGRRIEQLCSMSTATESLSSMEGGPTEAAKELYDKMLSSVTAKTMPPNAWLWSLIEKCANHEDIELLFDIVHKLRLFRQYALRIYENFNCHLCQEIARACVRVGALDFGKKTLWKHNIYGTTPSIASAHLLLLYAREHNDVKLMAEVLKLLRSNGLPYQAGTADIVCSTCYNVDNWKLFSTNAKRYINAGVKLRQTTFDMWMEFAARIGNTKSLWKIEKLRSDMMKKHSLTTGFSCAKGFLLERKPDIAVAMIQILIQDLPEAKRAGVMVELQKLINEWSLEVVKRQKEKNRKALAAALRTDIPIMVSGLQNIGLKLNINMEELTL